MRPLNDGQRLSRLREGYIFDLGRRALDRELFLTSVHIPHDDVGLMQQRRHGLAVRSDRDETPLEAIYLVRIEYEGHSRQQRHTRSDQLILSVITAPEAYSMIVRGQFFPV